MKRRQWMFVAMVLVVSTTVSDVSAQNLTCGLKPIPAIGCRIERCVDGMWEQLFD